LPSARRSTSGKRDLAQFVRIRMVVGRQLLFLKSEQCAVVQRTKREFQSIREFSTG
jgi:hypothetical protein